MNSDLDKLHPYPFEKLKALKAGIVPPAGLDHIALSIGEPRQPTPAFVNEAILSHLEGLSTYPLTKGSPELRQAICDWLEGRFKLPADSLDPEVNALPVNGTREALFAFTQAVVTRSKEALVLMPNPFYQIYEGAAILAGASPLYLSCTAENNFIPDFDQVDESTWDRCQLLFICSPSNPSGAVMSKETLQKLIRLAMKHEFVIASDECYSEIYFDEQNPPAGLLQAAAEMGHTSYERCVVFHSLSKRSNAPGLRSGFVAGDGNILGAFLKYRTYHGCAMPVHHQHASILAWQDEAHVKENRATYQKRFEAVLEILGNDLSLDLPEAGFYLWAETPVPDTGFARGLYEQQNVTVLPGSFLSRETGGKNPGENRIRMALVAPVEECIDAAGRIKNYLNTI